MEPLYKAKIISTKKSSGSAVPIELEMGLPGHHLAEIKSAQIDMAQGQHYTSRAAFFKSH